MGETETIDDDVKAGEFALGVLGAEERAEAERRIAAEPQFRDSVASWQRKLTPLLAEIGEERPPERLRERILAAVDAEAPRQRPAGRVRSLAFWRVAAFGAASIAAAALALLAIVLNRVDESRAPLAAVLTPAAAPIAMIAEIDPETGIIRIKDAALQELLTEADRVAELWLIPAAGAPRSLGVVDATGSSVVGISESLRIHLAPGSTLAVSVEPPGGSPTGAPTGPVIALGKIFRN